jgi:cytochrome c
VTERVKAALLVLAALLASAGCQPREARQVPGGDAERGRSLIRAYGCHSCHMIPGVPGADGLVGPPLLAWQNRVYIAGRVPNTPETLVAWIMSPRAFDELTVMPDMHVTEQDARDIAAYLFTLD